MQLIAPRRNKYVPDGKGGTKIEGQQLYLSEVHDWVPVLVDYLEKLTVLYETEKTGPNPTANWPRFKPFSFALLNTKNSIFDITLCYNINIEILFLKERFRRVS